VISNLLIFVSSLNFGGAEKQAVEDCNLLSEEHQVFVLTFKNGPLSEQLKPSVKLIIIRKKNYLRNVLKIASLIRKYKISVIHTHLYAPMVLTAFAGKLTHVPVIWNFHSHAYENSIKGKMLHKYAGRLSAVKAILFPATELEKYYEREGYNFEKKKCRIAYNSGQDFDPKPRMVNELNSDSIHIGFVGRIISLKRIPLLIELSQYLLDKEINNFKIDIVGDGKELENYRQSVKDKSLESHIVFHGFQQDTSFFYRRFNIFALPSEEEVLSLSLIDAGLAGLPSVAFNVGGNHEIIEDGKTGYIVNSKELFFEKITNLIKDNALRQKLGDNAYMNCVSKFSPPSRLAFLLNLYALFV